MNRGLGFGLRMPRCTTPLPVPVDAADDRDVILGTEQLHENREEQWSGR
jgi:hypothetical protein